jgi:hypothetical protein
MYSPPDRVILGDRNIALERLRQQFTEREQTNSPTSQPLQFALWRLPLYLLHLFPRIQCKWLGPLSVVACPCTARLPACKTGRDALHDYGASECEERITPENVVGRIVSCHLTVPAHAVLARRQPRHSSGLERLCLAVRPSAIYGLVRLQKSDSGWPTVAISQSRIPITRGSVR